MLTMMIKPEGKYLQKINLFCHSLSMMTKRYERANETHVQNQKWYNIIYILEHHESFSAYWLLHKKQSDC